jgi:hypothetical protein
MREAVHAVRGGRAGVRGAGPGVNEGCIFLSIYAI